MKLLFHSLKGGKHLLIAMLAGALIFCSYAPARNQIVLHGSNMASLTKKINESFKKGYTVKFMVGQSVGTSVNSRTNTSASFDYEYRDVQGEIMIVMESN